MPAEPTAEGVAATGAAAMAGNAGFRTGLVIQTSLAGFIRGARKRIRQIGAEQCAQF